MEIDQSLKKEIQGLTYLTRPFKFFTELQTVIILTKDEAGYTKVFALNRQGSSKYC